MERKLNTCIETVERIGASGISVITVLNKIDLISTEEAQQKIKLFKDKATSLVPISALKGTNIELLKKQILNQLKDYVRVSFTARITKETMPFMAWLFKNTDVQVAEYAADSIHVVFEANSALAKEFDGKIEKI
jgi:50S ribosomal subunit-associated GTPase HflX